MYTCVYVCMIAVRGIFVMLQPACHRPPAMSSMARYSMIQGPGPDS